MAGPSLRFFATTVNCPELGDSISEGTVQEWTKAVGDYVEEDEVIAVIETDKVVVDIRAPKSGLVQEHKVGEGDVIEVDSEFYVLDEEAAKPEGGAPAAKAEEPAAPASAPETKAEPAKPAETKAPAPAKAAPPKPSGGAPPTAAIKGSRDETRIKMTRMRKRIAERLKDAQNTAACLTTFNEVDMKPLMDLRKEYQEAFTTKHGIKLGFMSAFIKASCAAAQDQPAVNGMIDGDEIVMRDYVDVSVAVSTPTGLVTPVLRNCEAKSFAQFEKDLVDYAIKAREGKITLEDMAGGTFTISNGGVFGSLMGTPILNPP